MSARAISLLTTAAWLACAGGGRLAADAAQPPAGGSPPEAPAMTVAFDCDGFAFTAQIREQAAQIILPDRSLELRRVPAASGAKYAGGGGVFWNEGDEALLELGSARYPGCRLNRSRAVWEAAKLRGVAFRGVGNEPGWSVEIASGERIVMLTDYGRARVELPLAEAPTARLTARTTLRAHSGEHDLVLVIEPGPCQDSMSGETFESRVTAVLDARELRGCGRWLDAAPPARREGGLTPRRRLRA